MDELKKSGKPMKSICEIIESAFNGKLLNKIKYGEPIKENYYNPLTPTDFAEDSEIYIDSIKWALSNGDKIKNIAIAGPYGSGKSSIIRTFIKHYKQSESCIRRLFFPKYRFLNISLATFKDSVPRNKENEEETPDVKDAVDEQNKELLRLIELSILQQFFFHEKDSKTPDSRFKKIKSHKKVKLFRYTLGFLLFVNSILLLFLPEFLAKISLLNLSEKYYGIVHYSASIIALAGIFFIIYKSSRSLIGVSIKKLNISNASIEIDDSISKSILNNHLDEIIYFFEVTKYNVVIIEDLDRFAQTEVFTKLREINLLINGSNKINRDVVFIYAIKDDMFLDKDRAKFFDFMIPIIPVINFSNSGAKLRKITEQNNYQIREELLDDLSMFIDDMRLLYNIMNEYHIYSNKVDKVLDQNNLLSMIVYKNIFPNDFTLLSQNRGDLYKAISKKQEYIGERMSELDAQVKSIKEKISKIDEQRMHDIEELRVIYVMKVVDRIRANGFVGFDINNRPMSIHSMCSEKNFNNIIDGFINYFYRDFNRNERASYTFKFNEIEEEVDPELGYRERAEIINNPEIINDLKKEIARINEQKSQVQKRKLRSLVLNKEISIETDFSKRSDLINLLLRNGYIDENYMDYISIFHEGALTKSDFQFLIDVKTEKGAQFDYNLIKTEELLKKISEFAFEKEYVLNFALIEALLISSNHKAKKQKIFQQLANESNLVIEFIDKFIGRTGHIEEFISELCRYWTNIWNFIKLKSLYSNERKEKYFTLIIQFAAVDNIAEIFQNDTNHINNFSNFLNLPVDGAKLKKIINVLNLKFVSLDSESTDDLLDYVLVNSHFEIKISIIELLLSKKGIMVKESFEKRNYGFIYETKLNELIDYIELNIEKYVKSVYLKLEDNVEERNEDYLRLLNNSDLNINIKEQIIIKVKTVVEDMEDIDDAILGDLLFKYSKIKPTWNNVLDIFNRNENSLSENVIDYLNLDANSAELSKTRMTTEEIDGKNKYSELCKAIIYESALELKSYMLLTKSIPWWYDSFESEKLSEDRIVVLINNDIVEPSNEGFVFLMENYYDTNILLLERHPEEFIEIVDELELDEEGVLKILKSNKIDVSDKSVFINSCDDRTIIANSESTDIVAQLLIESDIELEETLVLSLIQDERLNGLDRIRLFNKNTSIVGADTISDLLISLGGEYKKILNLRRKATLENNEVNGEFLEYLKKFGFISSVTRVAKGLRVNHKRSRNM